MSSYHLYEQRVVYAALSRMTKDRNLIKSAYQYWDVKLSSSAFDVVTVVTALNDYLGLGDTERKSLMISMHAASNRLVDQLDPVPEYISDQGAGGVVQQNNSRQSSSADLVSTKAISAHKAVTERYLQLICQHVKITAKESHRELVEIVADEGLPKLTNSLNQAIQTWGNNGLAKVNFSDEISAADCQDTALEFYVLLSEIIGPVDSDVIVNKAIAEVLNMPEAQQFNPRNLL